MCGSGRIKVEGKSAPFSKLDYLGVEGNLAYESEDALNRPCPKVKEGRIGSLRPDFLKSSFTEGMFEK